MNQSKYPFGEKEIAALRERVIREMSPKRFHHTAAVEDMVTRLASLFCPEDIPALRAAALLHDVGKPFCHLRDGNSHEHPKEGARIAVDVLERLKAPKKTIEQVQELTLWHMYDFNCEVKENKLRRFFVDHYPYLEELLLIKQADYSGCMDDTSVAPTVKRWNALLETMKSEGAPLTLKELAIKGSDLVQRIPAPLISLVLKELLYHAVCHPKDNQKERLLAILPAALHAAKQKNTR